MLQETPASLSDLQQNNNANVDNANEQAANDTLGPHVLQAIRRKNMVSKRFYDMYSPNISETALPDRSENSDSDSALGRVLSNSVGTTYSVMTRSNNNKDEWQEVGCILYEVNILGKKGPRKMTVLLHATSQEESRNTNDRRTLAERYKENRYDPGIIVLCNRVPEWCNESEAYVLDFGGRVRMPSVKNFQLVHPDENDYMVLQFGRVGQDSFTLDLKFPMTPLLALGIAVSSMDRKLACS
ncbi:hypothetical protein FB639_003668 [Coemansia asiatica]|nr:hypothetical protein FB639_003668 [Coemansia asiatica]